MKLDLTPFSNIIHFAVGDKPDHCQRDVEIQIPTGNMAIKHRFIVVENLRYDVIVGIDLMRTLGLALSIDEESIYIQNGSFFGCSSLCLALLSQVAVVKDYDSSRHCHTWMKTHEKNDWYF